MLRLLLVIYTGYLVLGCHTQRDCHNRGDCVNGHCQCDTHYQGDHCETPFCVYGDVVNGECECDFGSKLEGGYCTKSCESGVFNKTTGECQCYPGWKTAGITDTINWFKKSCSQFECQSNHQCQILLPEVKDATCPIRGWNCDCGFSKLDYKNSQAGCMGFMYVLSIKSFRIYRYLCLKVIWKLTLVLMLISLPLGRIRLYCDHDRSWWAKFKKRFGYHSRCEGECVYYRGFRVRDDFAVSVYWFKSGLWWYNFLTCLGLVFIFSWSLLLWLIVIVILIGIGLMICCAAIGSGGGECGDCGNCDGCGDCGCYGCCCDSSTTGGDNTYMLYWGGPYPNYYGGYDYGGPCDTCNCNCHCPKIRCCVLDPVFYLLESYPRFPENLHGGLIGFLIGTHPVINNFNPNDRIVSFLSLNWTRRYDLRNNTTWRDQLRSHLVSNYKTLSDPKKIEIVRESEPRFSIDLDSSGDDILDRSGVETILGGKKLITYNYPVPRTVRVINQEHIYQDQECWICSTTPENWMIWSCDHVFCETCSRDMIDRGMSCPLCRMASTYYRIYQN